MSKHHHRYAHQPAADSVRTPHVGLISVCTTALSFVCLIMLIVGAEAGWQGFDETTTSAANSALFNGWFFGGCVATGAGSMAWKQGRRAGHRGDCRAGQLAIAYFLVATVLAGALA